MAKITFGSMAHFRGGDRVEIHPRFDRWMRGDRFGTVTEYSLGDYAIVKMDLSNDRITVHRFDLKFIP